jgi:glucose 1-dehydrogenase
MFRRAIAELGTIDILVTSRAAAGCAVPHHELGAVEHGHRGQSDGRFLCAREAVREFLRRGVVAAVSRAAGKIICVSSVHEIIPWAGHANYCASKGGVAMMMKTLAQEVAPRHIRVNSVAPRGGPHADQHGSMEHSRGIPATEELGAL